MMIPRPAPRPLKPSNMFDAFAAEVTPSGISTIINPPMVQPRRVLILMRRPRRSAPIAYATLIGSGGGTKRPALSEQSLHEQILNIPRSNNYRVSPQAGLPYARIV